MGIGFSVFLIAAGAILAFAVDASISGLDVTVVGWVLMLTGVVGLAAASAIFGPRARRTDTTVVEDVRPTRRVVEREVV